jgi:Uncharacterized protein conserved in bacteria (DUF2147)
MKKIIFFFLIALIFFFSQGCTQTKLGSLNKITGIYWSPEKDPKIEIYQNGERYFGKSVWVVTLRKDTKNPGESLRKRDVPGIGLLTNFCYNDGT